MLFPISPGFLSTRRRTLSGAGFIFFALLAAVLPALAQNQDPPEYRALWVDAWGPGFKNAAEVQNLVDQARQGHFNTLIIQVRRRGDAYYHSALVPRAADIAAGFDPLAEVIQRAKSGSPALEVHAWIPVFPLWGQQFNLPAAQDHLIHTRPEWLTRNPAGETWDGNNYQLDPGHPGVQQHIHEVAMELVSNYAIDAIHLDYIRYAGRNWGYNEVAVQRFNDRFNRSGQPHPDDALWLQWRRDQVTDLVRRIHLGTRLLDPTVSVAASTIAFAPGITQTNQWPGSAAYSNVLQDWRAWMEEGLLDLNHPMVYMRQPTNALDWTRWTEFAKKHRYSRHVAPGAGAWLNSIADTITQLRSLREGGIGFGPADGMTLYSYRSSNNQGLPFSNFASAVTSSPSAHDPSPQPLFPAPAPVPPRPWIDQPTQGALKGSLLDLDSGEPVDGAQVFLTGPNSRILRTDANGVFGAVRLPPGIYTLTPAAPPDGIISLPATLEVTAGGAARTRLFRSSRPYVIATAAQADLTGAWTLRSDAPDAFSSAHSTAVTVTGTANATATWTVSVPESGRYDVFAWHPTRSGLTTQARYEVSGYDGSQQGILNQSAGGGQWRTVRTGQRFTAGGTAAVTLGNRDVIAGRQVAADAVLFVLTEPLPAHPIDLEVEGEGTLTSFPAQSPFFEGDTLFLLAQPGVDNSFLGWGGLLNGTVSPASLTVSGPGTVQARFGRTFAAWAKNRFTAAELADSAISGPDADPDLTGLPNLLRYALGLDRTTAGGHALLPAPAVLDPTTGRLTLAFHSLSSSADLGVVIEKSQNLSDWESAQDWIAAEISEPAADHPLLERVRVELELPAGTTGPVFFRVRYLLQPESP
ncbi:MAG: hypothetical protein EA425_14070 [Puniceicoccaceae bacterium]|nr:MAG: hypothetical protein EA425_14070 [Puniceicoccaceae bacterium]